MKTTWRRQASKICRSKRARRVAVVHGSFQHADSGRARTRRATDKSPGDGLSRYRIVARTCIGLRGIQIRVRMCGGPRLLAIQIRCPNLYRPARDTASGANVWRAAEKVAGHRRATGARCAATQPQRPPPRRRGAPPAGGRAARPAPAPQSPPPRAAGSGPGPS